MKCESPSPDATVVCSKLSGHQMVGVFECRNPITSKSWCGMCGTWTCERHAIQGQPVRTLSPYGLDKLWSYRGDPR